MPFPGLDIRPGCAHTAAIPVDARRPVDQVVDEILARTITARQTRCASSPRILSRCDARLDSLGVVVPVQERALTIRRHLRVLMTCLIACTATLQPRPAAVRVDDLASDPTALRRTEESDELGRIGWCPDPAEGAFCGKLLTQSLIHPAGVVGTRI